VWCRQGLLVRMVNRRAIKAGVQLCMPFKAHFDTARGWLNRSGYGMVTHTRPSWNHTAIKPGLEMGSGAGSCCCSTKPAPTVTTSQWLEVKRLSEHPLLQLQHHCPAGWPGQQCSQYHRCAVIFPHSEVIPKPLPSLWGKPVGSAAPEARRWLPLPWGKQPLRRPFWEHGMDFFSLPH